MGWLLKVLAARVVRQWKVAFSTGYESGGEEHVLEGQIVLACAVGALLGTVALIASPFVLLRPPHTPAGIGRAVGLSAAAAFPGICWFWHLLYIGWFRSRVDAPYPHEVASFGPALLWVIVGWFFCAFSYQRVRVFRLPARVEFIRAGLVLGWLGCSVAAMIFAYLSV